MWRKNTNFEEKFAMPTQSQPSRPYTFDRVVRIVIALLAIAGGVWLVTVLKSVLLPFLVAWLVAYMLEPFVQYNKRLLRVRSRWLPITMTLFEVCLVVAALGVFVVPSVLDEMHRVADFIGRYTASGAQVQFISPDVHQWIKETVDFESIAGRLTGRDIRGILSALGSFIAGGYNIVLGIFNWFLVILYVVFIMLDYERLLRGFKHMVPPSTAPRSSPSPTTSSAP